MTDPKDPNDSPKPPGTTTIPPESGFRALFVSSRPPVAAEEDRTLGRAIAALLRCDSGFLSAVASDVEMLAEALAELTRAVRTLRGHLAQLKTWEAGLA